MLESGLDSATTLACPCLTKSPLGAKAEPIESPSGFSAWQTTMDLASLIKRRCSSDKIISVIIHHCWRQTLLYNMTMSKKSNIKKWLHTFIKSPFAAFIVGALIGLIFFAWFYGLDIVNPTYTDWIWHPITHDTAQHQLGWEFLRQDSDGLMINGLAYPVGLSAVFMDVIPLFALIFKPFVAWLPSSFQYFGIWGLLCYLLMGGLGAVIARRIWLMVMGKSDNRRLPWQYLAVAAGSLLFVLSPTVMARSFYHPALAGQWIILLGFIVIIDSRRDFKRICLVWCSTWALVMIAGCVDPSILPADDGCSNGDIRGATLAKTNRSVSLWSACQSCSYHLDSISIVSNRIRP